MRGRAPRTSCTGNSTSWRPWPAGSAPTPNSASSTAPSARAGGAPVPVSPAVGRGHRHRPARRRPHGTAPWTSPWGRLWCGSATTATSPRWPTVSRGALPGPEPVPGWRSVVARPSRATVRHRPGSSSIWDPLPRPGPPTVAARAIGAAFGCGVLVSLGGDLAVRGAPEGGFTVGIADVCGADEADVAVTVASAGWPPRASGGGPGRSVATRSTTSSIRRPASRRIRRGGPSRSPPAPASMPTRRRPQPW